MIRALAATLVLAATAATAQVGSRDTHNSAVAEGDADKVVCKKTEKVGTRLGATKTCLTVREWQVREHADRERTEGIQAGARIVDSRDPPDLPNVGSPM